MQPVSRTFSNNSIIIPLKGAIPVPVAKTRNYTLKHWLSKYLLPLGPVTFTLSWL